MHERLNEAEARFLRIEEELADPAVTADIERYTALLKEHATLAPVIEKFREYKKAVSDAADARAILDSESDPDLLALADEEYKAGRDAAAKAEEELKILLLPKDPLDEKNVVIEIRAGAGGDEAALFAGVLYRMYTMYADARRFKTEVVSVNETGLGGFREITFLVTGQGAYSRFKYESG
ncbi:MAG: PCRF domain-containing protein, partial [Clostridia bacterium]|nr:PCRF domain-containing protein [Clostridia bacterium]